MLPQEPPLAYVCGIERLLTVSAPLLRLRPERQGGSSVGANAEEKGNGAHWGWRKDALMRFPKSAVAVRDCLFIARNNLFDFPSAYLKSLAKNFDNIRAAKKNTTWPYVDGVG